MINYLKIPFLVKLHFLVEKKIIEINNTIKITWI